MIGPKRPVALATLEACNVPVKNYNNAIEQ